MQHSNEGRLIHFTAALSKPAVTNANAASKPGNNGQALLMEPRSVRHQERVNDLFYLLFKRTGS